MIKNTELVSVIYPDSQGIEIEEIEIPQDIKSYIDKIKSVKRFSHVNRHYPSMIIDNSKAHTIRCVFRAMSLPFAHKDLIRALWIHDIPEYVSETDVSAVERYKNPEVAVESEKKEKELAKEVLKESDLALFEDFILAEGFIRRSGPTIPKNQQTLVANVIDYIDGNLVGTYYFTKWLKDHHYDGKVPDKKALTYILDVRENTVGAIENPEIDKDIKDGVHFLLDSQLKAVIDLWESVEEDKVPHVMKTELFRMENLI